MTAYKEACEFGDLASGPYPPASTIFTEVYETVPWHVQEQREELGMLGDSFANMNMIAALISALALLLE